MITIDGLNVISMHEPDRILQGLSGVGIEYPCSSWPLGGSKTSMESSASKDTPSRSNRVLRIPFNFHRTFLLQLLLLSPFSAFAPMIAFFFLALYLVLMDHVVIV